MLGSLPSVVVTTPSTTTPSALQRRGVAAYTSPRFVALGHDFDLDCDDAELGSYLGALFSPLAGPGQAAHHYHLSVSAAAADLWFDDRRLCGQVPTHRAVAVLLWHINGQVIARSDRFVRLHAGGVARAGDAVLLPGAMEAGKSTLTAGLVRAGLDYLSDELVAVDPDDGHLEGFPRAVSLDPGAWLAFAEVRPRLTERLARSLPYQWQVPADVLRPGSVVRRARPATIVAPRLEPGAALRLERLPAQQVLVTLASVTFDLDGDPGRNLAVLGQLARTCPAYRLTFGDVRPAVAAVLDLMHASDPVR